MWLLAFLVLPTILVASSELTINNYVINIENNTLTSIRTSPTTPIELNLDALNLQRIENGSFNDRINAKILNLANNSIVELPKSVFSNLTDLEHLSLFNNSIRHFASAFVGLGNLKSLNMSNNPIQPVMAGAFYGLTGSVDIFMAGNSVDIISTSMFEMESEDLPEWTKSRNYKTYRFDDELTSHGKVCIRQGIVEQLNNLYPYQTVPTDCRIVFLQNYYYSNKLIVPLDNLDIAGFDRVWYRITISQRREVRISLRNNNIDRVTRELLNDLPSNVRFIDLTGNRIVRLDSETIVNHHLYSLTLNNNEIREIGNAALRETSIIGLYLIGNRLEDIQFMATLPPTIETVDLTENRISELPVFSFAAVRNLSRLHLDRNNITILRRDSLRELSSLLGLGLSNNRITTLEPDCFRDLKSLESISLRGNKIENIDRSLFDGPIRLRLVDIGMNKLTKISHNSLPQNLSSLFLDYNMIESLESGSFAYMPINHLSLRGNKISVIPKGTFNVPNRHWLTEYDVNDVKTELRYVSANWINYGSSSGFDKPSVIPHKCYSSLDLSRNPINKLENGALFGVRKHKTNLIFVDQDQIELIQGGLFDDV